jgi:hypothetical protein
MSLFELKSRRVYERILLWYSRRDTKICFRGQKIRDQQTSTTVLAWPRSSAAVASIYNARSHTSEIFHKLRPIALTRGLRGLVFRVVSKF